MHFMLKARHASLEAAFDQAFFLQPRCLHLPRRQLQRLVMAKAYLETFGQGAAEGASTIFRTCPLLHGLAAEHRLQIGFARRRRRGRH